MSGPSALADGGIPPWTIAVSVGAHLALGVGLVVAEAVFGSADRGAMVPEHTMVMLSPGTLPKQQTILPERPTRTPDAPQVAKADDKAPPPPPKESELKLPDKEPEPEKGKQVDKPVDRTRDRAALLRKARKEALVKDPNAALGDRDQARTSPDGATDGAIGESLDMGNPEFAAWMKAVQPVVESKWVLVEADRRQYAGAKVVVWMRILPDGTIQDPKVTKKCGSPSIDRAALMAVFKTARVKPPPASLRASFEKVGFTMSFTVPSS